MSEIAIHSIGDSAENPFNARTMLLITAIGTLAFIAMLVLGAYAPDLRSGRNGGTHALSNAATGFSGLVRLADATGRRPVIVRVLADLKSEDLAVVTPDHGSVEVGQILNQRGPRATLIILPKWDTTPDREKAGWVRVSGLLPAADPARMLYPSTPLLIVRSKGQGQQLRDVGLASSADIHFREPAVVQTMSGKGLEPMITTADGRIILARVAQKPLYLLSEPDLLNNHGMGNEGQARSALVLLDLLNSTGAKSILFDVTANGLGRSRSPLKLAFDPPFLGVTLTIFVAMLLAGWQALVRFGPIGERQRAIAFGKSALIDNSAALIRKADRQTHLGRRYVDVVRNRAVVLFRLPLTLDPEALSIRLEGLNPDHSFASAAQAAINAQTRQELLSAAKSLNRWLKEVQQ